MIRQGDIISSIQFSVTCDYCYTMREFTASSFNTLVHMEMPRNGWMSVSTEPKWMHFCGISCMQAQKTAKIIGGSTEKLPRQWSNLTVTCSRCSISSVFDGESPAEIHRKRYEAGWIFDEAGGISCPNCVVKAKAAVARKARKRVAGK